MREYLSACRDCEPRAGLLSKVLEGEEDKERKHGAIRIYFKNRIIFQTAVKDYARKKIARQPILRLPNLKRLFTVPS